MALAEQDAAIVGLGPGDSILLAQLTGQGNRLFVNGQRFLQPAQVGEDKAAGDGIGGEQRAPRFTQRLQRFPPRRYHRQRLDMVTQPVVDERHVVAQRGQLLPCLVFTKDSSGFLASQQGRLGLAMQKQDPDANDLGRRRC